MDDYQSTIISNNISRTLKTGNVIIDTLVAMVIANGIRDSDINLIRYVKLIYNFLVRLIRRKREERSISFKIQVRNITVDRHASVNDIPIEYKAIVHKMDEEQIEYGGIILINRRLQPYYYDDDETDHEDKSTRGNKYDYLLDANKIQITSDVYFVQNVSHDNAIGGEKHEINYDEYIIELTSTTLSAKELRNTLDTWIHEYRQYIMQIQIEGLLYITAEGANRPDTRNEDVTVPSIEYREYKLVTDKSFDNLFFDDKEELLHRLEVFSNDKEEYKRKGIPHNFGLLLHGEPGCGKTSCIKAMAKHMNRHIIEVNLAKIKTTKQLRTVFYEEIINDMYIPVDKRIIVMSDIDCMSDIVKQRKGLDNGGASDEKSIPEIDEDEEDDDRIVKKKDRLSEALLKQLSANTSFTTNLFKDESNDMTLSFLLNIIDGILEQHGRVFVMDTNIKKKLDKALIRPGRINMEIHFGKCSRKMYKDILEHNYRTTTDREDEFPHYRHTPSDMLEICASNRTIDNAIQNIITGEKPPEDGFIEVTCSGDTCKEIMFNVFATKCTIDIPDNIYTPRKLYELCYTEGSYELALKKIKKDCGMIVEELVEEIKRADKSTNEDDEIEDEYEDDYTSFDDEEEEEGDEDMPTISKTGGRSDEKITDDFSIKD